MKHNKISVFEYDKLKIGCEYNGVPFSENLLETLECFHASSKIRYFNLIHNGVEFCEYVGVLQVGSIQIEVLPKLDKSNDDINTWRDRLIGMLKEVGMFRVSAPSKGMLTIKPNSILELYFDIFITEVEYLVRTGLVKQYRKQTLNHTALKGSLDFPGHIAKNLVHKERFYTKTSVYDYDHIWHTIIRQTIDLIRILSQNTDLHNRIGALNLNFPEITPVRISEQTFNNLIYSRKTESYRAAIEIARLLLLSFHPDLASGNNHVLALMFDMNLLWESFVYHSLRKLFRTHLAPYNVRAQTSTPFWRASNYWRTLRPDILIESKNDDRRFVLDTKWKDVSNIGPSSSDLQQLFAYSQFFFSSKNALLYPCRSDSIKQGRYALTTSWSDNILCSIINLGLESKINKWQETIYIAIINWMHDTEAVCL
ncbi:MAG: restriction endonuclease [Candidatus Cloacimonetes bacterium]|nr:restriction endonuclease [Candidatus Cloacimonadota bacterium]